MSATAQAVQTSNVIKLNVTRLKESQYERRVWSASPQHGTPFEKLLDPNYWAHVAPKLKPWDRIEVQPDGIGYFAELLVVDADRLWAKVKVIRYVDFTSKPAVDPSQPALDLGDETPAELDHEDPEESDNVDDNYLVEFKGSNKWSVIRKADGEVLKSGYPNKGGANKWLRTHLRRLKVKK